MRAGPRSAKSDELRIAEDAPGSLSAPALRACVPADQADTYRDALAKMYDTPEWEEVRARNGWVNIHNSGDDFTEFLENQEAIIKDLMTKLGFL